MSAPVFLLSDFGTRDAFVGIMRAVIATLSPASPVHDLVHDLPPQDVGAARWQLAAALPYLPDGAVVCAVVDPGVGGARRAVAVRARRHDGARLWAVAPDNGLLAPLLRGPSGPRGGGAPNDAADPAGWRALAARVLPRAGLGPDGPGTTFDGRDVFAPAAARLARGDDPTTLGEATSPEALHAHAPDPPRREGDGWRGTVQWIDRFGNLVTDLRPHHLPGAPKRVRVDVDGHVVHGLSDGFSAVGAGQPVAYLGSLGTVEVGLRDGNAASRWGVRIGCTVRLETAPDVP